MIMIIMYSLTVHKLSQKFKNLNINKKPTKTSCLDSLKGFNFESLNYMLKTKTKKCSKNKHIGIMNVTLNESAQLQLLDRSSNKNHDSTKNCVSCQIIKETKIRPEQNGKLIALRLANNSIATIGRQNSSDNQVSIGNQTFTPEHNILVKTSSDTPTEENKIGLEARKNNLRRIVKKQCLANRTIAVFKKTRESNAVKNERKAVKVLGIVFVIFCIAWIPFAIVNMLSALCPSCDQYTHVLDFLVWLGYISSSVNPIVYTVFSEKFRFAFKMLLCCKFHKVNKYSFKRLNKFYFERKNDSNKNQGRSVTLSIVSSQIMVDNAGKEMGKIDNLKFNRLKENDAILEGESNIDI